MRKSLAPAAVLLLALCASPQIGPHGHSYAEAAVVKKPWLAAHRRHSWTHRRAFPAPRAHALRSSRNGCSNNDCIGINSSNGIGGSGGF